MTISSPAFENGGTIPEQCTREGGNQNPPLRFEDIPANAKSLALIFDDPDGPQGTFTHWIAFNMAPSVREIGGSATAALQQACNDFGQSDYGGPRRPSEKHRYFFKLFALDDQLSLPRGASRLDFEEAILGRVIAEAEFMGRFASPAPVEAIQVAVASY